MQNRSGFTLIEVLVAATIVSIVIVGAFLLLSSATRQGDRTKSDKEAEEIELSVRSCIGSLPFGYIKSIAVATPVAINFGANNLSCATGSYDTGLTFTGITLQTYSGTGTDVQTLGGKSIYQAFFSTAVSSSGSNIRVITQKIIGPTGERSLSWNMYGE